MPDDFFEAATYHYGGDDSLGKKDRKDQRDIKDVKHRIRGDW